jgi:hypothetical protein
MPKEPKILGVPKSEIEKRARVGESYEQAAARIKAERASKKIKAMKEILETA